MQLELQCDNLKLYFSMLVADWLERPGSWKVQCFLGHLLLVSVASAFFWFSECIIFGLKSVFLAVIVIYSCVTYVSFNVRFVVRVYVCVSKHCDWCKSRKLRFYEGNPLGASRCNSVTWWTLCTKIEPPIISPNLLI